MNDQFERALSSFTEGVSGRPEDSEDVRVGDIRLVSAMDWGRSDLSRMMLITEVKDAFARAILLTNEIEYAADADFLVSENLSRLPYPVLAEADLQARVWKVQLGLLKGTVPERGLVSQLARAFDEQRRPFVALPRALPPSDQSDPRWTWKQSELAVLQGLARDCMQATIDGTEEDLPYLDPASLLPDASGDLLEGTWQDLLDVAEEPHAYCVPAGWLREIISADSFWPERIGVDAWMALEPLWHHLVTTATDLPEIRPTSDGSVEFLPERLRHDAATALLESLVLSSLAAGRHELSMQSRTKAWSARSEVVRVDVKKRGIFQLSLMRGEDRAH